jgi:5S rRNA maturation endonuclease (ribonuclease M5)
MRRVEERREALRGLRDLLLEAEESRELIVVEGMRDVAALRALGYGGEIEVYSRCGLLEADLVESFAERGSTILILTDFDEEGRRLSRRLARHLEMRGVRVDRRLRREVGRLMALLGVYAVEALDDVAEELERRLRGRRRP